MTIKYSAEARDHLIKALHGDLIGPVFPDLAEEVLAFAPSRFYLTGFIAPQESRDVLVTDEDEDLDVAEAKADQEDAKEGEPKEKRLFPASIGMSVLLPAAHEARELRAIVSWADYVRLEDVPPPERPEAPVKGKKKGKRVRPIVRWKREPKGPVTVTIQLDEERLRKGFEVPGSRGLEIVGELLPTRDMTSLPPGTRALSLFLVNARKAPDDKDLVDREYAFQVSLALEFDAGFVPRRDETDETSSDPDERVADLQYRNCCEYAVGHGIAVRAAGGERPTRVETTWLPRGVVRRVEPRKLDGVTVDMDRLGSLKTGAEVRNALDGISKAYAEWITTEKSRIGGLGSKARQGTAKELLGKANRARLRIDAGLDVLEQNPQALAAFCLMNRAMAEAARRREGRPELRPAWRLFQLAFVLLNVSSLVDPTDEDRRTVDLIFFPTGGGKTEAYLGVIAFLLLYRRLTRRSKPDLGLGVTVILRYTLRLLTLDQLGRAATLICALEQLRKQREAELGDIRFSLGLWVGQSATANTLADAAEAITEYKNSDSASAASPFPLTGCPWCRKPLEKDAFTVIGPKSNPTDLRVACTSDCDFSTAKDPEGLPVLFVDEQIYHELPCFLIATVDKFAMLPWRGETGGFFGRVSAHQGRRFFGPSSTAAPKGARPLPDGLQPPDLIVQDELHLISGPLGTMIGLYETAIEDLAARPGPGKKEILPKIIASTATVRRAHAQIQALYGRTDLQLFPPPSLDENESFFACVDRTSEGRTYVGVAAPGRAMKGMLLRIYVALLGAAERCAVDSLAAADPYLTLVGYFNSLRELGGMRRLVEDEVRGRVASIEDRRPEATSEHLWVKNRTIGFEPVELTSRRTTAQIAQDKTRLETSAETGERVDVCLASNMISVGVDIQRLGLMVIAGQPKTASEYIQASSRVGRQAQWPGLVVTVLNVNKARDRSHFERFAAFHESFYREVEATSVTPFADPALLRGMAGALVTMTRLRDPELTPSGSVSKLPARRKSGDASVERLAARAALQPNAGEGVAEKVRHLGKAVIDSWQQLAEKDEPRRYSHLEKRGAKGKSLLFTVLDIGGELRDDDEKRFATPTSMRDVEASAHLWIRYGVPSRKDAESDD